MKTSGMLTLTGILLGYSLGIGGEKEDEIGPKDFDLYYAKSLDNATIEVGFNARISKFVGVGLYSGITEINPSFVKENQPTDYEHNGLNVQYYIRNAVNLGLGIGVEGSSKLESNQYPIKFYGGHFDIH